MVDRNHTQLSFCTIIFGVLLLSLGFNILQFSKIQSLENRIKDTNYWVSFYELKQIEQELKNLEESTISVLKK